MYARSTFATLVLQLVLARGSACPHKMSGLRLHLVNFSSISFHIINGDASFSRRQVLIKTKVFNSDLVNGARKIGSGLITVQDVIAKTSAIRTFSIHLPAYSRALCF